MANGIAITKKQPNHSNQRVVSFGKADRDEDTPYIYRLEDVTGYTDIQNIIWAGYRQVFSEHEILSFNRQKNLESQLKNGSITVRDFIRGLAQSEAFYRIVVEVNNNYRLVDICLRRLLGRKAYNKEEEIAWSIKIATLGWGNFVDALIDSEEYLNNFGENTIPYQRRRYKGRPFNLVTPRYAEYWRDAEDKNRHKWGDINNFMDMANSVSIRTVKPQSISTANIEIPDMTKQSKPEGIPVSISTTPSFPLG